MKRFAALAALAALCLLAWTLAPAVAAAAGSSGETPALETPPLETPPIETLPGYFDVDALDLFTRDDLEIRVSVHGVLLQMVAKTSAESDPDLAAALEELQGVEVRVYSMAEEERGKVRERIDRTAKRLETEGWAAALTVQVRRDHGYALLRYVDGKAQGLAALYVTDDNQAVFVNIVGRLDPEALGRLTQRFDLDHLEVSTGETAPGGD